MKKSDSSSDDEVSDDEVQASVVPYVGVDSDDERPPFPALKIESTKDLEDFKRLLSDYDLDKKRPASLIDMYKCIKCNDSLGEFKCDRNHRLCFRCRKNPMLSILCKACKDGEKIIYEDSSHEFKKLKDMFGDFRQYKKTRNLKKFLEDHGAVHDPTFDHDQSFFGRKYLKYKQKYLALKNMRGL